MIRCYIIGQGALGADFTVEAARRCEAAELDMEFTLIDFDDVEHPRNCVSQAFLPTDAGKKKSEVIAGRLQGFKVATKPVTQRLTRDNWEQLIKTNEGDYHFIIDAVDNAETRGLLWEIGLMTNIPVLHLGISPKGTGHVTWNYGEHDTFPLSPKTTSATNLAAAIAGAKDVKLPPCELNALRSLILVTACAGVSALFIACGSDLAGEFREFTTNTRGVLSVWDTERWAAVNRMDFSTQENL